MNDKGRKVISGTCTRGLGYIKYDLILAWDPVRVSPFNSGKDELSVDAGYDRQDGHVESWRR